MKKLLMAAITLSCFAIALSLVQISCSKAKAQAFQNQNNQNNQNNATNATPVGKIIYAESIPGVLRYSIANYDGSGIQHLNIPFPAGFATSSTKHPVLSPDATKIFFEGRETANMVYGIYSCDTSGANFTRIINCDPNALDVQLGGAY
ncbi:MAG: hypothetical protein QM737_13765 [Ferruginibacter sp.]